MSPLEIIAWFGGIQVVASGVSMYASRIIQDRLLLRWKLEFDKKLVEYTNALQRQDLLLTQTLATINQGNALLSAKRLDAIEKLWPEYISHRENLGSILSITMIGPVQGDKLFDSRLKNVITNADTSEMLDALTKFTDKFQIQRPIIGDSLWQTVTAAAAYFTLYAIRCVDNFQLRKFVPWNEEASSLGVLKALLDPDEYDSILKLKPLQFNLVSRRVDSVVLREVEKLISNEELARRNYELSSKFLKIDPLNDSKG